MKQEYNGDRTGQKCESCGKGRYKETSIMDDWEGVLHCDKCGHRVDAYEKVELPVEENVVTPEEKKFQDMVHDIAEKAWRELPGYHKKEVVEALARLYSEGYKDGRNGCLNFLRK